MIWIFLLTQAVNKAMEYIIAKKKKNGNWNAGSQQSFITGSR